MKQGIHPQMNQINVECMCGNVIQTLSTRSDEFKLDVCSSCHPVFTGQERVMDTAGRVERFRKKYANKG
ncbi:50S ribosomal protein L31 [Desulfurispirillum indicum]|uniref:Large ribosomal subunit protein bL31 n=1 Tax=Desulfurispirillum indicum (strain ATCC BAA-1389 / DSM 22839 / S5) TaxID=653733 RepID=E6W468_DESIS|nr:50S ribosomal protein L31 [Desulfurispirillum indicum]ADU67032.1 ribosomal protein L31 [Desulfurispirillum indicum S5]UCZ56264.1 50S ribosomal protein L31 [Desulfurispirillum indicum]